MVRPKDKREDDAVLLADSMAVVSPETNISAGRGGFAGKADPEGMMPLDPTSPGLVTS